MDKTLIFRFLIGVGGLCLVLWASSWLWMSGISFPVSLSGHRIDVGVNSGYGYIVCVNAEKFTRPFAYALDSNWQRPSETGAPGQWQKAVPIHWIAVVLCSVGGIPSIIMRKKTPNICLQGTSRGFVPSGH